MSKRQGHNVGQAAVFRTEPAQNMEKFDPSDYIMDKIDLALSKMMQVSISNLDLKNIFDNFVALHAVPKMSKVIKDCSVVYMSNNAGHKIM